MNCVFISTSLSVINFKPKTFEINLFIQCTSVMKIRKEKKIYIFNFIYIFHLDFW
jgi:hypothetical protein